MAIRTIDEKTTEALLRQPLGVDTACVKVCAHSDPRKLDPHAPNFLSMYDAARCTEMATTEAELTWFDFARLCLAFREIRAIRKTLKAGLYFTDQAESIAESLLLARCVELGYHVPYLQVNVLDPHKGRFLGRVDGLWPSPPVLKGLRRSDGKYGRLLYSKQRGDNGSVVVEFDGSLKYRENYATTLENERQRQNAIGNLGFRFVRIGWSDLMKPERLHIILKTACVPRVGRTRH